MTDPKTGRIQYSWQELTFVVVTMAVGLYVRIHAPHHLAVEHFDEGVYASAAWYDDAVGESYPFRFLYAPPLLSWLIDVCSQVPSFRDLAPFLPSIVHGTALIVVSWWVARLFFGLSAGLMMAAVVSVSDFHILLSRMALTDVPALTWIVLSVGLGGRGIHRGSFRTMIAAGAACAVAWWFKYTGWLPLAIVVAGSSFWWLLAGRSVRTARSLLSLQATMIATAFLIWCPVLLLLADHGGYAAVAENHAGYLGDIDDWQNNLASHLTTQFDLDSWLGGAAIAVGLLFAGFRRWVALSRFTWNADSNNEFPSVQILLRFVAAGIMLGVVSLGISTIGVLACVGAGGLCGIFLWPVLSKVHSRMRSRDRTPESLNARPFTDADFDAAPSIDPVLSASIALAWLVGMLLATPFYFPFPRLVLPLLAAVWMSAAGGISWWIEATLSVARRGQATTVRRRGMQFGMRIAVSVMAVFALAITGSTTLVQRPNLWQDRTSLQAASRQLAMTCAEKTHQQSDDAINLLPSGTIISPGDLEDEYALLLKPDDENWNQLVPIDDLNAPGFVVYAFGEPSVLFHLHAAGITARPIQDLEFGPASWNESPLPTFLVLGPNALRTPGLLNRWAQVESRFQHVADVRYTPSEIVLRNLFSPRWVFQHPEARLQSLELYELRQTPHDASAHDIPDDQN